MDASTLQAAAQAASNACKHYETLLIYPNHQYNNGD